MSSISLALPDDSLAASRPTILRRADEPVAQAAHPVRDHRLPVRPAPAELYLRIYIFASRRL